MKVLITGGAGYIGSTIALACADKGLTPVIVDDLSVGRRDFVDRFLFYEGDYGDADLIERVLTDHPGLFGAIHCAARTVAPESMSRPLEYYDNNVAKFSTFLTSLVKGGCRRVVASSSASLYAPTSDLIVDEDSSVQPSSPYGASKWMCERMLADAGRAHQLQAIALRYFNPIGTDPAGRSGMVSPDASHVLAVLMHAVSHDSPFTVTGTLWPTRDGSGLRDYVHVWDLALAHVAALTRFDEVMATAADGGGFEVINLGTGRGTTVWELVAAFERATGQALATVEGPARPGDVAGACASGEKAWKKLGWRPERTVADGIEDSLRWARAQGWLA